MRYKLSYLIVMALLLTMTGVVGAEVFSDSFEVAHDFVTDGVAGTDWDGFLGLGDNETVDALNASMDRAGELYMASTGAYYHEPWEPLGPLLYKVVEGDFVATVKVTDYAGTADVPVYHNNCGLIARAMPEDAGDGEDWVALDYFPIWSCGNFVRTADDDVRTENGHNSKAFDLDPYLQIERVGNTFHFRTSADGVTWTEMAVSPITRDDFADLPLQIGLYQATYNTEQGYVAFDDITIEGPQVVPGLRTYSPKPVNEADDVTRQPQLSWDAPVTDATYNVYFGTSLEDVEAADLANPLDVLVSQGQSAMSYAPDSVLELSQTYYWRVDLIAADGSVYAGSVWSFTAEPFAYAIADVTATTNGISDEDAGPENTVNGSGLSADDTHSAQSFDMWAASPNGAEPLYIQYEFDRAYKLHELRVWNYNMLFEAMLGFSLKDVTIEYSTDGAEWTVLKDAEFAQGTARADYTANTIVDMEGVQAQFVRLTINSGYGLMGKYGLSEVRFLYIATKAREPEPAHNATAVAPDDVTLNWRPSREAASHDVHFGTSKQAVIAGSVLLANTTDTSYALGDLELAMTYYWKIDEVNDAEAISRWEGDIWSFTTQAAFTVEDFESYDDDGNRIYDTWIDGWVNETGSTVGYLEAPFAERSITHGGRQSLPMEYSNADSPFYSETERTWATGQNWTTNAADTLMVYFRGHPVDLLDRGDGTIVVGGGGADIAGTADEFRFVYKRLSGDGSIVARVDTIGNTNGSAKAGVMIRESLDPTAKHAMVAVTPGNGIVFQDRSTTGTAGTEITAAGLVAPYWVKVTRTGSTLTAERSQDGINWVSITDDAAASSVDISMISGVYIGLAVTSHDATTETTAEFSNVTTTGSVSGAWQAQAVGVAQLSNDPTPLYVTVTDSAGHSATIAHSDPEVSLATTWQQWNIPLADLTAAGVNMAAVKALAVGVGDPANPAADGTGMIYLDDIQVGRLDVPKASVTETESFDTAHDFLTDGVEGTFWDGFLGLGDNETVDALNASVDREGQLFIQSTNAFFHEPWTPIGPFLYKVVEGNFVATVKVSDYAGTAAAPVYHNTCGLMARAFPEDAGPGEDWVSIDYFPIWSCGNFVRSADDNARTENGNNGKAFGLDPYLQIERVGNTFHLRTSADGVTWTEMAVSPLTRNDLADVPLQIGLFEATYNTEQGYAAFDDFVLETF